MRTLRLLRTFVLRPLDLATALRITPEHAAVILKRLEKIGYCTRFQSGTLYNGRPALWYRLREQYL